MQPPMKKSENRVSLVFKTVVSRQILPRFMLRGHAAHSHDFFNINSLKHFQQAKNVSLTSSDKTTKNFRLDYINKV